MSKLIQNGWFCEINDLWYGQAQSLEIEEILVEHKSKYQDILIFKSKAHGNVLALDGCIQLTEKDECSYQELISFLPLNSHPNPKKVLVIGAGDGGVIRDVSKHPLVEYIVQCEIDEDVIRLAKEYLPQLACGYTSIKHKLHVGCGREFMKQNQGEFDVVITDSSDPVGPAAVLFEKEYYELIRSALKPGGILISQGQIPLMDAAFVKNMMKFCEPLFPVIRYCYINVPTYPSGQIGFLLCSRNKETKFEQPITKFTPEQQSSLNIQFYNADVHTAAFALPQFFDKMTEDYDGRCFTENKCWFWENLRNIPSQSFGLVKKKVLFQEKRNNHDVLVFESYVYDNVLVLDDVIQFTEQDVYGVQETIAHLSLSSHPDPKKVLIIGSLNGGIIQEVSRHDKVETIIQCEMNEAVIDISKKYFKKLSTGYSCPKLKDLHFGDYVQYLKQHPQEFDVIITVPSELFSTLDSCENVRSALKPNGIAISKVSSFWSDLDNIHKLFKHEETLYPVVCLAYSCVPTCPNGQATFVLRSLNGETNFKMPIRQLSNDHLSQLEFYNPEVHKASFALPEFVRNKLET